MAGDSQIWARKPMVRRTWVWCSLSTLEPHEDGGEKYKVYEGDGGDAPSSGCF